MIEISQEEAVRRFAEMMQQFSASGAKPRLIIETALEFYRDYRIKGASIEDDEDMLLLQWGTYFPNLLSYFTDFRPLSDKDLKYDSRKFQYVGLTRQIFIQTDEEAEFDDDAIGISVDIFFGEAVGGEPQSNFWVHSPG